MRCWYEFYSFSSSNCWDRKQDKLSQIDYDIFDETNSKLWEQVMTGIRAKLQEIQSKNILLSDLESEEVEPFTDDPFFSTSLSFKIN